MIVASTFSRLPSAFLAPMRPVPDGSTMLPWFYGLVGLAVPFASIPGAVGGVRRARSGNRLGWAAAAALTAGRLLGPAAGLACGRPAVTSVLVVESNVVADEARPRGTRRRGSRSISCTRAPAPPTERTRKRASSRSDVSWGRACVHGSFN